MTEDDTQQNSETVKPGNEQIEGEQEQPKPDVLALARFLFLSEGQRDAISQLQRDIDRNDGKRFKGDLLAAVDRLIRETTNGYYLSHSDRTPDDKTNMLHALEPMPLVQRVETAEDLASLEDPVVKVVANVHTEQGREGMPLRSARVALIRRGKDGILRAEAPGKRDPEYQKYALERTKPPLSGGPSWGPNAGR